MDIGIRGTGIVVGLGTFAYRVMRTIGDDITTITPSRGVAADRGATVTVLTASHLGIPISTTHTLVGAIVGVGTARGITSINLKTVRTIFTFLDYYPAGCRGADDVVLFRRNVGNEILKRVSSARSLCRALVICVYPTPGPVRRGGLWLVLVFSSIEHSLFPQKI